MFHPEVLGIFYFTSVSNQRATALSLGNQFGSEEIANSFLERINLALSSGHELRIVLSVLNVQIFQADFSVKVENWYSFDYPDNIGLVQHAAYGVSIATRYSTENAVITSLNLDSQML